MLPPRWRRHPIVVGILFIAAVLAVVDRAGLFRWQGDDYSRYHNQVFTVVNVVDGDTIDVDARDGEHADTRIRLWGVDTPEVAKSKYGEMHYGPEASAFTKATVLGKRVRLELVPTRTRDKYRRLLAYVYVAETGEMLNELLVQTGHAYADPRFDHPFRERFRAMEAKAERAGVGLWAEVTPDKYPEWKQRREQWRERRRSEPVTY
jgi:micrococcal nuclease